MPTPPYSHPMEIVEQPGRIESTFNRIAAGSRLVAAVWMGALGAVEMIRGNDRPGVVMAALIIGAAWAVAALWAHAGRSNLTLDPRLLVVDGVVAVASILAASISSATISFYGGLPLIVVGIAALRSRGIALASAGTLAVVQLSTLGVKSAAQVVDQLTLVLAYLGIALLVAWIVGVLRNSQAELERANAAASEARAAAVRETERAEISRHLHDSVLQTLALIQRNSEDAREVTRQARRQERELRDWLYGEVVGAPEDGFCESLRSAAASVEERFAVSVDVVCVGTAPAGPAVARIVAAATEAMVNAAKHAEVEEMDVYGEVGDAALTVYVRDRGRGFDPAAVASGRRGVADSIIGRMESIGGSASVRTGAGRGTEWFLTVKTDERGRHERHE